MLNAIGIPSKGLEFFIRDTLPRMKSYGVPVIVSVAGETTEEFVEISRRVEETGDVDIIELNLSCPNLSHGREWAQDESLLQEVIEAVGGEVRLPLAAKLSPAVTDIVKMARLAERSGASVISMINTYKGVVIDVESRKPVLGNVTGGLSGPAILPLAVHAVYSVYEAVSIPIIGMGGIAGPRDALQHICAGASAVAVGMYNFVDPMIMKKIVSGLDAYLDEHGIGSLEEIIGSAHGSGED
jgi:dihydroorotate dehydrogenase (NAD+) catalytic subunit